MPDLDRRGEILGMNEDETAFYDALTANGSAVDVLGDKQLAVIAHELFERDSDETTTPVITPTLMLLPPSARPGGPGPRLRSAARVRELAREARRSP